MTQYNLAKEVLKTLTKIRLMQEQEIYHNLSNEWQYIKYNIIPNYQENNISVNNISGMIREYNNKLEHYNNTKDDILKNINQILYHIMRQTPILFRLNEEDNISSTINMGTKQDSNDEEIILTEMYLTTQVWHELMKDESMEPQEDDRFSSRTIAYYNTTTNDSIVDKMCKQYSRINEIIDTHEMEFEERDILHNKQYVVETISNNIWSIIAYIVTLKDNLEDNKSELNMIPLDDIKEDNTVMYG